MTRQNTMHITMHARTFCGRVTPFSCRRRTTVAIMEFPYRDFFCCCNYFRWGDFICQAPASTNLRRSCTRVHNVLPALIEFAMASAEQFPAWRTRKFHWFSSNGNVLETLRDSQPYDALFAERQPSRKTCTQSTACIACNFADSSARCELKTDYTENAR